MYFVTNADLDKIYTERKFELGARSRDEQAREFIFVKYESDPSADSTAVVGAAGLLALGLTSSFLEYECTCDQADAACLENRPMGFLQAALADGNFGWAQYKGKNRKAITTGGGVDAAGELLFALGNGTVDGGTGPANCTYTSVGVALAVDSGTTLAVGSVDINIQI
jgi:hypothetical protein